ncbi:MAG: anti-sigma factor [Actinomycetota bacterium]
MSDTPNDDMPIDDAPIDDQLAALLADESMWDPPDRAIEDAIVAAIADEATSGGDVAAAEIVSGGGPSSVVPFLARPRIAGGRWIAPFVAGAAAVLLIVGAFALFSDDEEPEPEFVLVLEATDLAPESSGTVEIDTTPIGTRILLDVAGLPPAAEGQYYEAWLRTGPDAGVSAGTFHLRGGDGEIVLWAGVVVADYPLFTITVQDEADPASSGQVVLRALVES